MGGLSLVVSAAMVPPPRKTTVGGASDFCKSPLGGSARHERRRRRRHDFCTGRTFRYTGPLCEQAANGNGIVFERRAFGGKTLRPAAVTW